MNDDRIREEDLTFIYSLSSAESNLERAKSLLLIAQENLVAAKTLYACSAIVMAACLEQATQTKISYLAEFQAMEDEIKTYQTPAGMLLEDSLRWRVTSLPSILSDGKFEFNNSTQEARDLHELISLRNDLVHVKEAAVALKGTAQNFTIEGENAVIRIRLKPDVWDSVDATKAQNFLRATEIYIREIINPENIQIGSLVRRAT